MAARRQRLRLSLGDAQNTLGERAHRSQRRRRVRQAGRRLFGSNVRHALAQVALWRHCRWPWRSWTKIGALRHDVIGCFNRGWEVDELLLDSRPHICEKRDLARLFIIISKFGLRETWLKFVGAEIILDRRSVAAVLIRLDSRNENLRLGMQRSTPSVSSNPLDNMLAR